MDGSGSGDSRTYHGTSWILRLLPYIEAEPTFKAWNFQYGVGDIRRCTRLRERATWALGDWARTSHHGRQGALLPNAASKIRPGIDTI